MIVSSVPAPTHPTPAPTHHKRSSTRRVTFHPQQPPPPLPPSSSSRSLLISAIFPSSPSTTPRASSAAFPQSRSWGGAYWASSVPSRASSVASGASRSPSPARARSAGSPAFRASPRASQSPGLGQQGARRARQSPSMLYCKQPVQQDRWSTSRSSLHTSHSLNRTLPANPYLSSAHGQQQQQRRPTTSSSVPFYSRRLGAEVYPRLERSDLEREKALFRSGSVFLEQLLAESARSQSAGWRGMGGRPGGRGHSRGGGGGDSFCRSSLAEAHMNNADVARVFHVIPQRVQSAKRGDSGRGISVMLQTVNQTLCHRRQLVPGTTSTSTTTSTTTTPNNKVTNNHNDSSKNSDEENQEKSSNSDGLNINDNKNNTVSLNGNKTEPARSSNAKTKLIQSQDKNKSSENDEDRERNTSATTTTSQGENDVRADTNPSSAQRPEREPRSSSTKTDRAPTDGNDPEFQQSAEPGRVLSAAESLTGGPPHTVGERRVRGVGSQDHSREWVQESQQKHHDSVSILSHQLHSMLPAHDTLPSDSRERQQSLSVLFPRVGDPAPLTLLPCSLERKAVEEEEEEEEEVEGGKEREVTSERVRCMKKMQCEVLGPYSCSDCTKIRRHQRQHQQQTSLYPDLLVDPRALVAPDRLRRLTASLPTHLTSQPHKLDCGCAINMHPDFLFPVIVTDHDIQSRLKMVRSSSPTEQGKRAGSILEDFDFSLPVEEQLVSTGGGRMMRRKTEDAQILVLDENREEERGEEGTTAVDMKVTVRYTTPSPEHGNVFLTN